VAGAYEDDESTRQCDERAYTVTQWEAKMSSTNDVLDRHIKCFFEFDLDGILSDYAPDAVLFTPQGPRPR
jgi:hypothetical protein